MEKKESEKEKSASSPKKGIPKGPLKFNPKRDLTVKEEEEFQRWWKQNGGKQ